MPKLKTHKGTKKRVRVTGSGKLVREHAFTHHKLSHKSAGRKRNNSGTHKVSTGDKNSVKRALGI